MAGSKVSVATAIAIGAFGVPLFYLMSFFCWRMGGRVSDHVDTFGGHRYPGEILRLAKALAWARFTRIGVLYTERART